MNHFAKEGFEHIMQTLFPPRCIGCRVYGTYICKSCLSSCEQSSVKHHIHTSNKPSSPHFENINDWIFSCFSYKDQTIKRAIWDIKFHGKFAAASAFGKTLAEAALHMLVRANCHLTIERYSERHTPPSDPVIIVPIPPSETGSKKRGYNQTYMIARALKREATFTCKLEPNALLKTRGTIKQATIHDRTSRLANMSGVFEAKRALVRKKVIILVDDIVTTGATLSDAKRALYEAGAKHVIAITIAH